MRTALLSRAALASSRRLSLQLVVFLFLLFLFISMTNAISPHSSAANDSSPMSSRSTTVTPTVSTTPKTSQPRSANSPAQSQSIPGQTQVDDDTIALYHFDTAIGNQVIDATGRFTGTLQGNARIDPTGLYGGVLNLDGNGSYVRIGNLGYMPQGTIEAYVDFINMTLNDPINYSSLIFAGSEFGGNTTVMNLGADTLFDIYVNGVRKNVDSGVNPSRYLNGGDQWQNFFNWRMPVRWPYETWRFHHIAATWGPRGMEIWLDGVLHAVGVNTTPAPPAFVYFCNPQMYVGTYGSDYYNPMYPDRCITPVPAPQMTPYPPPGAYFGPMPAYDTFLIGCGSTGNCFRGRIDEVRISKIQRTFSYTLIPTLTPTPTQTPVPIAEEYGVDNNTVVLFHMNSSLCPPYTCVLDAVSNQTRPAQGTIVNQGRFNSALSSTETGLAVNLGQLGASPSGAVEAWVKLLDSNVTQPVFAVREYYNSPYPIFYLGAAGGGVPYFGISDGTNTHSVSSGVPLSMMVGSWHHLAGTWGSRGLEIWVDGILRNVDPSYTNGIVTPSDTWLVGCDFSNNPPPDGPPNCMKAVIDEVRVSNVQRTFTSPMYRLGLPYVTR